MAINKGVAPPDISTEVGKFRALVGDLSYTELDPPVSGFGNYALFSDAEIEVFLDLGDSQEMAAYYAFMQLAASAARTSTSVSDFDLKIDTTKTPVELRMIAQAWKDKADAASADVFELFDVNIRDEDCTPELAAPVVRRGFGFRLF